MYYVVKYDDTKPFKSSLKFILELLFALYIPYLIIITMEFQNIQANFPPIFETNVEVAYPISIYFPG